MKISYDENKNIGFFLKVDLMQQLKSLHIQNGKTYCRSEKLTFDAKMK